MLGLGLGLGVPQYYLRSRPTDPLRALINSGSVLVDSQGRMLVRRA